MNPTTRSIAQEQPTKEPPDGLESDVVLGASASHLLLAVSQVDLAVLLANVAGDITYVNPRFTTLTGYGARDILGESLYTLRSEVHSPHFYRGIQRALLSGETWSGRVTLRKQDGTGYHSRSIISPLRNRAGETTGYSVFFRDTTEELKLEAQLRQVQKMEAIGEMAAGIAHEINTPIQYVGDNIQFLQEAMEDVVRLVQAYEGLCEKARTQALEPAALDEVAALRQEIDWDFLQEEVPAAIAQALEGRNRVAEIVRAMKEFAHPGDETLTPIDLNHAIENTLAVSRSEWKLIATVETHLQPDLPAVPCYPGSFNQVLLNLVVNAAHAIDACHQSGTQEKGCITLSTAAVADTVELRVQDSGCGIPEAQITRIFEPFFTTKDIGKGTGQGLALTHSVVVERMGGSIDVESTVGEGTTFILRLPLRTKADAGSTG